MALPDDHRRRVHRLADLVVLFAPHIPYHIEEQHRRDQRPFRPRARVDLPDDARARQQDRDLHRRPRVLSRHARGHPRARGKRSTWSATSSRQGEIADQFVEALCERARAGVRVTLVLDAIGSFGTFRRCGAAAASRGLPGRALSALHVVPPGAPEQPHAPRAAVVDGRVAFVGGAGVADWWAGPAHGKPMWRDMMARIEGPVVSDIQGIVAENWLECCGEILTGPDTYKPHHAVGHEPRPSRSRARRRIAPPCRACCFRRSSRRPTARVLHLDAVLSAGQGLPARRFVRTARARRRDHGDRAGPRTPISAGSGWRAGACTAQLLEAGVRIFEYEPGMTHVKALLVDDLWAVVGTTNLDNRSFEHNDEVNVGVPRAPTVTARLTRDFDSRPGAEPRRSRSREWRERPLGKSSSAPSRGFSSDSSERPRASYAESAFRRTVQSG